MSYLENLFNELLSKLREPGFLNPAKSDPVFYYVYPPEKILKIKKALPRWSTRLTHAGFTVKCISLSEILWRTVDETGRWEEWLELEEYAEQNEIIGSVRDALRNDRFINILRDEMASASRNSVILLTEAELLHPFFRTQLIESKLHDNVAVPVVIFYPGTRSGQYGLRFLGFYPVDGNYRSTLLGGI
mgnify:CR=1 FL=1